MLDGAVTAIVEKAGDAARDAFTWLWANLARAGEGVSAFLAEDVLAGIHSALEWLFTALKDRSVSLFQGLKEALKEEWRRKQEARAKVRRLKL